MKRPREDCAAIRKPPREVGGSVWAPLAGSTPVAFVDHRHGQCRWPVHLTRGEHHACGLDAPRGRYCATHEAMAYLRPSGSPRPQVAPYLPHVEPSGRTPSP
jgi:hypothetical protein